MKLTQMNMKKYKIRGKMMISLLMTMGMVTEILAVKYGRLETQRMMALKRKRESSM